MLPADGYGRFIHFACGFLLGCCVALPLIGRIAMRNDWALSTVAIGVGVVGLLVGWWASRSLDGFWNGIGTWFGRGR